MPSVPGPWWEIFLTESLDAAQPANQIERVLRFLLIFAAAMALAILLFGLAFGASHRAGVLAASGMFIFWGWMTAFVAFGAGGALGLLFGLPTPRPNLGFERAAADPAAGDQANVIERKVNRAPLYDESTSLGQVADFLVKGLIALSLTSFDSWTTRFDNLAGEVSSTMLGGAARCLVPAVKAGGGLICTSYERVPGGMILAGFAIVGFLTAYLWMRRYFIDEMTQARTVEGDRLADRLQEELVSKRSATSAGLTGIGASTSNDPDRNTANAEKIADEAVKVAGKDLKSEAMNIQEQVRNAPDADDPWKNQFGGLASQNGCSLSASVTPLISDPDNFQVDLLVKVDTPRLADLAGKQVHYYLHPTFGADVPAVPIAQDGTAPLQIFSYGGFTVGALVDDGTKLELDLAQIPGVPEKFRAR